MRGSAKAAGAGQSATFMAAAIGAPPLNYQWQENGVNMAGATSFTYATPPLATTDNGSTFDLVVTNANGSVTSNIVTLTVDPTPGITTQPLTQTVSEGQTATYLVVATSSSPISYQWQKNGANIPNATLSSYTTPVTVASDDATAFTVVLTNTAGSVTSSVAMLFVNSPPAITAQPVSQTVIEGEVATFTVTASGSQTLAFQWQENGIDIVGATSSSYVTPATSQDDTGEQFTVVVTDAVGSISSIPAFAYGQRGNVSCHLLR